MQRITHFIMIKCEHMDKGPAASSLSAAGYQQ
jgi:hypothetical protein